MKWLCRLGFHVGDTTYDFRTGQAITDCKRCGERHIRRWP